MMAAAYWLMRGSWPIKKEKPMSQSITLGCSVTRQRSPPLRTRTAKAAGTAIAVLVLSVTLDATASARGWTAAADKAVVAPRRRH